MRHNKEKTVFILTFWFSTNFGTTVQNFALTEKIKSMGFNPKTILWVFSVFNNFGVKNDVFSEFRKKHIPSTEPCFTQKELNRIMKGGDRIIIGADQVFGAMKGKNGEYRSGFRFGGDFVSGRKVLASYAASYGVNEFKAEDFTVKECSRLLQRFDRLGVREGYGVELLKNVFGVDGIEVLDPVFLIPPSRYQEIIDETENLVRHEKDYIAYLMLRPGGQAVLGVDPNLKKRLEGETILNINLDEKGKLNTVGQWLYNIKNAKLVITNSFHCTALAIIFRRPFIALEQGSQGVGRLRNITANFRLQHCLKAKIADITADDLNPQINWDEVDAIQKERLEVSERYLNEVLTMEPTYKEPFVSKYSDLARKRYDRSYAYRLKGQHILTRKGMKYSFIEFLLRVFSSKKAYEKFKATPASYFADSKNALTRFLGYLWF